MSIHFPEVFFPSRFRLQHACNSVVYLLEAFLYGVGLGGGQLTPTHKEA